MSAQRILVIEDDLDIANVLRMDLGDAGYAVEHADSAMNGLIRAREDHPDLILLDLGLPDFDGGDVVQRLRKNSAVPIIVLTARDTVDEKVRLLGLGADDYLIKPFSIEELLARVRAPCAGSIPPHGRGAGRRPRDEPRRARDFPGRAAGGTLGQGVRAARTAGPQSR